MKIMRRMAVLAQMSKLGLGGMLVALAIVGCSGGTSTASPSEGTTTTPSVSSSPTPTLAPTPTPSPTPEPGFSVTGSMSTPRFGHTATLLPDGSVLVAGGDTGSGSRMSILASAELYDPATGKFSPTGSMAVARFNHTATLLPDGRVLVAGGSDNTGALVATAELYDPASGTFSPTGSMAVARTVHTATLLPDGSVLVAGGVTGTGSRMSILASAELYNPATGKFSPTGSMAVARGHHTTTLLPDGSVLVAGGGTSIIGAPVATAELYDPATGKFSPTGSMATARDLHTATLLPDGSVLVAGGSTGSGSRVSTLASAELYDPATGKFSPTGSMATARQNHTATLLPDGSVLIAGGLTGYGYGFTLAELYDTATGKFSPTGSRETTPVGHTATMLPNGRVLVVGGVTDLGTKVASAELYQP